MKIEGREGWRIPEREASGDQEMATGVHVGQRSGACVQTAAGGARICLVNVLTLERLPVTKHHLARSSV